MRAVAIGGRSFITGFRLAGISGVEVSTPDGALQEIRNMMQEKEMGLIIISDEIAKYIRVELTEIRAKQPVPLMYELPAPGSRQEKVEYRTLIKSILKI